MEEKIIIDITLEGINKAKKDLQDLNDETARLALETKELTKQLKEVEKEQGKQSDAYKNLSSKIEDNNSKILQNSRRKLELTVKIREATQALKSQNEEAKKEQQTLSETNRSLVALRARLAEVVKARNDNKRVTKEEIALYQQQTREAKALVDELKEQEGAIGDNRRNVGNYAEAIKSVIGDQTGFIGQLQQIQGQLIALRGAIGGLTNGMKGLKAAFIGSFIGALIVLLGTLIAAFLSTKEGADKLSSGIAALGVGIKAFFNGLKVAFEQAGKLFSNFFSNVGKTASAFTETVKSALQFDIEGVKKNLGELEKATNKTLTDLKEDWNGLTDEIVKSSEKAAEAITRAYDIEQAIKKNKVEQIKLREENAKYLVQLEQLKKASDNVLLSDQERIEAAIKAAEIQNRLNEKEILLKERELKLVRELNSLSDSDVVDMEREAGLVEEIAQLKVQAAAAEADAENKIGNIKKEAFSRDLAAVKTLSDAELALYIQRQQFLQNDLQARIDTINLILQNENLAFERQRDLIQERSMLEKEAAMERARIDKEVNDQKIKNLEVLKKKQQEELGGVIKNAELITATEKQIIALQEQNAEIEKRLNRDLVKITQSTYKAIDSIAEKSAQNKQELDALVIANQLAAVGQLTGAFAQLAEKNFELNKAFSLATAIIDGIAATIRAFKTAPDPVTGTILAAAVAAAATAQVIKIAATTPQNTSANIGLGGGGGIQSTNTNNTVAANESTSQIDLNGQLANQIRNTLQNLPSPIVAVRDINNAQRRVQVANNNTRL